MSVNSLTIQTHRSTPTLSQNEAGSAVRFSSVQPPLSNRVTVDTSSGLKLRVRLSRSQENEVESTACFSQPFLLSRITIDISSGIKLRVRFSRNFGMIDRLHEEPSQKRRRVESSDDSSVVTSALEDSAHCNTDKETSSNTDEYEPLASSSSSAPVEQLQEGSLPTDDENSLGSSSSSPLTILARVASVASLKMAVNTDFELFKRLVRAELESEDKLSDLEWQEVFIDVIRNENFEALIFLLEQPCITPRIQTIGATEALRTGASSMASFIMTVGTMGPKDAVDRFLEEAGSMGESNLIRLALMKDLVSDALANKLISHGDKLMTQVSLELAKFNLKKPLRGDLLVRTIEKGNTTLAIALLKNNASIRPSHRGKAARLLLEKKDYDTLEALLSTKQLLTNGEISTILFLLRSNKDPQAIGLFRNYFQKIEQYRHFAASML